MKEIIAILRPNKVKLTKEKLAEAGILAYTEVRVSGRGRQQGVQYGEDGNPGISFLPKRMLQIVVPEEQVEAAIQVLLSTNKTGEVGDGKIFVCPIEDSVRIRTDERGVEALV